MRCEGAEKLFVQALIQITVAFHHRQRGNFPGAKSLLRRALGKLERYPPAFEGVDVGRLRGNVEAWLEVLDRNDGAARLEFPPIR